MGLGNGASNIDHINGEKPRAAGIRFPVQQRFRGRVGSESKSSEGVHDGQDLEPRDDLDSFLWVNERKSHRKQEALWNSDNNQCY